VQNAAHEEHTAEVPSTTAELVEIVRRLQAGEGTEDQDLEWLETLRRELPDPNVTNLIFYRDPPLTAEEVVAEARRYRPIEL
jgi:hypothetical protein